jgi:hypothetical protein
MMKMMMRWEPVCHKTEWQWHCVLRHCSSALSIYSSLHMPAIPNTGGGGYRPSTWYIWLSQLDFTPTSWPSIRFTGFSIRPGFLYNYFVTGGKWWSPFFFSWRYTPPIKSAQNNLQQLIYTVYQNDSFSWQLHAESSLSSVSSRLRQAILSLGLTVLTGLFYPDFRVHTSGFGVGWTVCLLWEKMSQVQKYLGRKIHGRKVWVELSHRQTLVDWNVKPLN